jgi:hypothetical protein
MHGQYMPTAASKKQKTQKADCSERGLLDSKKQTAEVPMMATSKLEWSISRHSVIMLKARDEARVAAIKLEKMTP